jgi:preprotein translocase subunit SecA
MVARSPLAALVRPVYPERPDERPATWLDEQGARYAGKLKRALRARAARRSDIVARVRACEPALAGLDLAALRVAALDAGKDLRRDGFRIDLVARAFAIVSATSALVLEKRHFDVQLLGGWVLLQGMVAEMETGEGKTLTATLATCTAALAGIPVHVITVNDYLVARDAELTRPLYEALGLTVGVATEQVDVADRQAAYACHITYASNKIIVFDYLRDRVTLARNNSALRLQLEKLRGSAGRTGKLLMRGLHFAIVDEADSVLADEARTPLIISAPVDIGDQQRLAQQGIDLGRQLEAGVDYRRNSAERSVALTDAGRARVAALAEPLGGLWNGRLRREEMATQALSALHLFVRDDHYLVRDGKVEIIDENTGRTTADRSWERGLHQLIEAKEELEVTAPKEALARISYQRFFRRYLLLSGMTGTAAEVAGELGTVYQLAAVKIPTNRVSRRVLLAQRVLATQAAKWDAIVARVAEVHAHGQPVLLGTRSVAASEHASALLTRAGLPHQVLNAKQDSVEADVVACAGEPGRITIATNMAGRGTDIKLAAGAAELGGLYVILSERYDSMRIDRQLAGRCARQGDPGAVEAILSMEDSLISVSNRHYRRALAAAVARFGPALGQQCGSAAIRFAQRRAERAMARARLGMLKIDQQSGKTLAFSGSNE